LLFCRQHGIRQGYVPMFIAGFEEAEIVGTCEKLKDPKAPVWSRVYLENVEALGCGTPSYFAPVSTRSCACWAISFPRSQVSDRRSCSGNVVIAVAMASRIASAP
jgi:hypothetical protein